MNALYHTESASLLLKMSVEHDVPLLFITNNTCNKLLRFQDSADVAQVRGRTCGGGGGGWAWRVMSASVSRQRLMHHAAAPSHAVCFTLPL